MGSAGQPNAAFWDGRRDDHWRMMRENKLSPGAALDAWRFQSGRS